MTRVPISSIVGRWLAVFLCGSLLASCAETEFLAQTAKQISRVGETPSSSAGTYKIGNPYQIKGAWYQPVVDYGYDETGIASWYGPKFHGRSTANGERFDMNQLTAAHRTLPLPSFVRVTNLENGRSLVLRVNDRGPFARGRIIDISRRGAQLLGFERNGTARVRVAVLAAQSQAIAARMQGTQLASADSPLTVDSLPTVSVSSESLPPPPGGKEANNREIASLPSPVPTVAEPVAVEAKELTDPVVGVVSSVPAEQTQIFIQAGAFGLYDNANRVRANIASIGNVNISSVLINNRDLFRVRVGPVASVEEADTVLEQVARAGYNDARIIIAD